MDLVQRVRDLTGATHEQANTDTIVGLLRENGVTVNDGGEGSPNRCGVLWAAADLADQLSTGVIGRVHVTSVEDISVDRRRTLTAWQDLADRLRARAADCEDAGPFVVPYRGACSIEAVEHGRP